MSEYAKIIFYLFNIGGNEFTTQILLFALLYIPVFKKRKLFYVRYPACFAVIIGLQMLKWFGYFPVPDYVNYVLVFALVSATVYISFQANIMQSLFTGVCIYGGQHVTSNLAYALIYLVVYFTQRWELFNYYYVIMPVITVAGMVATYFLPVRILRNKQSITFNKTVTVYFTIAFVLVASILTHFARQAILWSPNGLVCLLIIASLFTDSTLLVGFMNTRNKQLEEENVILQELLHKDKQRYEQAKLSNEKIQIKYHDMKQHTHHGVVDYESLKEIEPDSEILKSTYFTGNRALDVILSEKALMCERLGIKFICTADGETVNFMKPYHIYSLVGNALENAIESLKNEEDESLKELTVSIVRHGESCVIKTVNCVKEKVVMVEGLPQTIKSDKENHGFGARSMRNVVNTYGGQISFYEEDNMFTMIAVIPIPQ